MADLLELCASLRFAKTVEEKAKADRVAVEDQILALVKPKEEGATTTKVGDYTLTVTGKVSRKMDWAAWDLIKSDIPVDMHPIKTKVEVNDIGVKWLKEHRSDLYAKLPLTVTPAKTSVEIKFKESTA